MWQFSSGVCRLVERGFESAESGHFSPDAGRGGAQEQAGVGPVLPCALLDQAVVVDLNQKLWVYKSVKDKGIPS